MITILINYNSYLKFNKCNLIFYQELTVQVNINLISH